MVSKISSPCTSKMTKSSLTVLNFLKTDDVTRSRKDEDLHGQVNEKFIKTVL